MLLKGMKTISAAVLSASLVFTGVAFAAPGYGADSESSPENSETFRNVENVQEEETSSPEDKSAREEKAKKEALKRDKKIKAAVRKMKVKKLRRKVTTKSIRISWSRPSKTVRITKYRILKRQKGAKRYHLAGTSGKRSFVDRKVKQGKTYYYKVQAETQLSSYSKSAKVISRRSDPLPAKLKMSQSYKRYLQKKKDLKYAKGISSYIKKVNSNVGSKKRLRIGKSFVKYGKKYDVSPCLLAAIAKHESTYYSHVIGAGRYYGLMQTNASLGRKYAGCSARELLIVENNVKTGAAYLGALKKSSGGNTRAALTRYCGGSGAVSSRIATQKEIRRYLQKRNYI